MRLHRLMRFLGLARPGQVPLMPPRTAAISMAVLGLGSVLALTAMVLVLTDQPTAVTTPLQIGGLVLVFGNLIWVTRYRRRHRRS
jgi:hypothetical protein